MTPSKPCLHTCQVISQCCLHFGAVAAEVHLRRHTAGKHKARTQGDLSEELVTFRLLRSTQVVWLRLLPAASGTPMTGRCFVRVGGDNHGSRRGTASCIWAA